jgi:hypothetical protein
MVPVTFTGPTGRMGAAKPELPPAMTKHSNRINKVSFLIKNNYNTILLTSKFD